MATRKAKLPTGINVRTRDTGYTSYEWQVVRDGTRKRQSGYPTIKAAQDARDDYLKLLDGGATIEAVEMTVGDLHAEFVEKYVDVVLSPATKADYDLHWRNRVEPLLDKTPLRGINKKVARDVVAQLKKAGTGNRTINKTITFLSSMWSYAMETHNGMPRVWWTPDYAGSVILSRTLA
jgi:hypothetical protein